MAIAFKSQNPTFFQLKKNTEAHSFLRFPSQRLAVPVGRRFTPMAALSTAPTVGLSETFKRLKNQGKVSKPFHFDFISTPSTFCFFHYVSISFSNFFMGCWYFVYSIIIIIIIIIYGLPVDFGLLVYGFVAVHYISLED
jgi:hypothetical protein